MSNAKPYRVFYDEQCEVCQAGVTWLKLLDRKGIVQNEPMNPEVVGLLHESAVTSFASIRSLLEAGRAQSPDDLLEETDGSRI